jgi:hypothetical protein
MPIWESSTNSVSTTPRRGSYLMQARPIAETLGAIGLLSKIDAALADLK